MCAHEVGFDIQMLLSEFKSPNEQNMMVRPMNLHLSVDRPGNFCCSDGTCISSELVCDGNQDCSDDELDYYTRIEKTQMRDTETSQETDVLVNVSIMELLEVSQEKSSFSVFFWIKLEWKNSKLAFKFLHNDYQLNNVETMTNMSIWIPQLRYYHIYDDQMRMIANDDQWDLLHGHQISIYDDQINVMIMMVNNDECYLLHRGEPSPQPSAHSLDAQHVGKHAVPDHQDCHNHQHHNFLHYYCRKNKSKL